MLTGNRLMAALVIRFLERLLHSAEAPTFLILDGYPVHRSSTAQKFLASTDGRSLRFFLSLEPAKPNPDGMVWNHLWYHGVGKTQMTGREDLRRRVIAHLRSPRKPPDIVRSFLREWTAPSLSEASFLERMES